jgi:hypothetical protein
MEQTIMIQVIYFGPQLEVLKVGTFIATFDDELGCCSWRKKFRPARCAPPMVDDERYPEGWRVPTAATKPTELLFNTICRILEVDVTNCQQGYLKRAVLAPESVKLMVQVYARPADIGEAHSSPFEVVETDHGV